MRQIKNLDPRFGSIETVLPEAAAVAEPAGLAGR
jgi:hypothetical protein